MKSLEVLKALSYQYGISPSFTDLDGQVQVASTDTLKALLTANGLILESDAQVQSALAEMNALKDSRILPEEIIISDNTCHQIDSVKSGDWRIVDTENLCQIVQGRADDSIYLPALDSGIYELIYSSGKYSESVTLIVAPERAPTLMEICGTDRLWGVNAALYGLRSERNSGLGDYMDLASFIEILATFGGSFLGINPVHALGFNSAEVISPYSPSHRSMLNSRHIALDAVPGLEQSDKAAEIYKAMMKETRATRDKHLIDYTAHHQTFNKALKAMFSCFQHEATADVMQEFSNFTRSADNMLHEFAQYECLSDHFGSDWRLWPDELRRKDQAATAAVIEKNDLNLNFHLWTQWLADKQLHLAQTRATSSGMSLGLYLDLAVGTRHSGAECYCDQDVIATGVSIGAPPDQLSPEGQNWSLAAYAPKKLRAQHYKPFQRMLRSVMRHASMLRIDHVLGLYRSFWIPDDGSPGAYIKQPFEALLAIVKIEAKRAGTVIIGEDLGLVPTGFRERIRAAGLYGYSVLQFEQSESEGFRSPRNIEEQSLSCFGTHDTATLAGFERGTDIEWWRKLNWIDQQKAHESMEKRRKIVNPLTTKDSAKVLNTVVHTSLARSNAAMVSIQLDDILQCTEAQNLPGTIDEHPNWRRRYETNIESIAENTELSGIGKLMQESNR